jgi:hypothetical protein
MSWALDLGPWALLLFSLSCARPPFVLPAGAGAPAPEAPAAWAEATSRCGDLRTLSSELRLSGRAGSMGRLRATILTGVTADGRIRLEVTAPFGRPLFVLAGGGSRATLLTRDDRWLLAPPDDILEALVGLALGPEALLDVLSGCGLGQAPVEEAARFGEMLAVWTSDGRVFLRQVGGRWRVAAAERGGLLIDYRLDADRPDAWPDQIRVTSLPGERPEIALSISQQQVEVDVTLPTEAFTVPVPAQTVPLTLDELRAAGPLGERAP